MAKPPAPAVPKVAEPCEHDSEYGWHQRALAAERDRAALRAELELLRALPESELRRALAERVRVAREALTEIVACQMDRETAFDMRDIAASALERTKP